MAVRKVDSRQYVGDDTKIAVYAVAEVLAELLSENLIDPVIAERMLHVAGKRVYPSRPSYQKLFVRHCKGDMWRVLSSKITIEDLKARGNIKDESWT